MSSTEVISQTYHVYHEMEVLCMMHNPDQQKNVEQYNRIEKDKLEQRYATSARRRLPWKYVGIIVGVVAIVVITIILI